MATRPHGLPKSKPKCTNCGEELVGDEVLTTRPFSISQQGIEESEPWFLYAYNEIREIDGNIIVTSPLRCTFCKGDLGYYKVESLLTYWDNGGIRQKPGRKPKQMSNDPAA